MAYQPMLLYRINDKGDISFVASHAETTVDAAAEYNQENGRDAKETLPECERAGNGTVLVRVD